MRLTNDKRRAFIRAVMADVPETDFKNEARRIVGNEAAKLLPPKVRAVYEDETLRANLNDTYTCARGVCGGMGVYLPGSKENYPEQVVSKLFAKLKPRLDKISAKHKQQEETRGSLRQTLRSVAYGVTTVKALRDALPEFERYMPDVAEQATKNLPAPTDVVSRFRKAGWPKPS